MLSLSSRISNCKTEHKTTGKDAQRQATRTFITDFPLGSTAPLVPRSSAGSHARWSTWLLLFLTCQLVIIFLVRCYDGAVFDRPFCLGGGGAVRTKAAAPASSTSDRNRPAWSPNYYSDGDLVFDGVEARAFEPWRLPKPLPCFPAEHDWRWKQQAPATRGLIFVKPFKTGSSTASGVNLRMARNIAMRLNVSALAKDGSARAPRRLMCQARSDHASASDNYRNRDPVSSWMWTVIREPSARVVSQFFHFRVSRGKHEPSDDNFRSYLRDPFFEDYYLRALSLEKYSAGQKHNESVVVDVANSILREYNFVAVTERMEESIVAMTMLLNVPLADVLYMKVKSHGSYDDGGGRGNPICTFIWPSFVSPGMQEALDSELWRNASRWDRALHKAANRSLDLTIQKLGMDRFETKLELYRTALARSQEMCLNRTVFPCSAGGRINRWDTTDCLWNDAGCGYECLDEVADELNLWSV